MCYYKVQGSEKNITLSKEHCVFLNVNVGYKEVVDLHNRVILSSLLLWIIKKEINRFTITVLYLKE